MFTESVCSSSAVQGTLYSSLGQLSGVSRMLPVCVVYVRCVSRGQVRFFLFHFCIPVSCCRGNTSPHCVFCRNRRFFFLSGSRISESGNKDGVFLSYLLVSSFHIVFVQGSFLSCVFLVLCLPSLSCIILSCFVSSFLDFLYLPFLFCTLLSGLVSSFLDFLSRPLSSLPVPYRALYRESTCPDRPLSQLTMTCWSKPDLLWETCLERPLAE